MVQTVVSPFAGRLTDRVQARYVASAGMAVCVLGLGGLRLSRRRVHPTGTSSRRCACLGLGFGFFATPIVHSIMGSVERRYTGVASATIGTMRLTGQSISIGLATLVLAVIVGPHEIIGRRSTASAHQRARDLRHLHGAVRGGSGRFAGGSLKTNTPGGRMNYPAPFALERFFARHEFSARFLLSASDCQGPVMAELLAGADPAFASAGTL